MSSICLGKYFTPSGDGFAVNSDVKSAVHFSTHDVLIDKSFQSFELITCRHLLAYLDQASQSQIVTFFHHSLRPGGFLFLGDAEFAESLPEQFVSVDSVFKIYQLKADGETFHIDMVEDDEEEDDTLPTLLETDDMGDGMVVRPARDTQPAALDGVDELAKGIVQEIIEEHLAQKESVEEMPPFLIDISDDNDGDESEESDANNDVAAVEAVEESSPHFDQLDPLDGQVDANAAVTPEEVSDIVDSISGDAAPIEEAPVPVEISSDSQGFAPSSTEPVAAPEPLAAPEPVVEAHRPQVPEPDTAVAKDILTQLHRSVMLQEYAPASLLLDRSFKILDHTGRIDRVFDIKQRDLTKDYLDQLPDFHRLKLEEALNQIFHEKDVNLTPTVSLPGLPGKQDVTLEIQFMNSPDPSHEIVHVLLIEKHVARAHAVGTDDMVSFFASPAAPTSQAVAPTPPYNGVFNAEKKNGTLEELIFRCIKAAPYPILLHVEGGNIIELSQPWVEMAGVTKEEAPTISAWTKKAKGQRLKLKDSKLKESYKQRGVVCISIRTKAGDTKLLAFHSSYLGVDSQGRKLTVTMAVDITNYPGHSGMGITPEVADFGVAAKKAFLANMSHEIRTPLTSMIGFADYLSDKLSGQDVQFARYISDSGNRLLETLNSVLRISSMDGIEQVLRYEMLDITVEAQGILQLFKPHAEQFGIPLKLIVEQPAKAKLDRASFRRILSNLLGNAIKFTPEGEVTITVNSDVNSVIVEIEDTGIGITEEFLPFIFDRFSQESKGQGRAYSGCGLGLAICKQLVETMGGTIQVETEAGVGSKFSVRLPKEPRQQNQAAKAITSRPDDDENASNRPQILIVEDNVDTQELMLLILRNKYDVTITSNASETLAVIQDRTFDAILMDLNLGGRRTGFELIRELRQINTYEAIPVLAVSALPIGVIRKQLIREGFNGYIAKPFTRARIMDALEGVLNLSS